MASTVQTPSAAYLRTLRATENPLSSTSQNGYTEAAPRTIINRIATSLWLEIRASWSKWQDPSLSNFVLWPLCISLLVISCVLEQKTTSLAWLRFALCLACCWLVPISIHIRSLTRKFRDRGRDDSFIVATASLSSILIKAFAMLDGYSMVALIRIPPCLTLAVWIAGHWCNSDVPPHIHFGV